MPFVTLNSDGLSIVCALVAPDLSRPASLSFYFPADITDGLSGRESRRPEAESQLLTLAHRLELADAAAQELRQTLATLGKSWVGVPIYLDTFLGADAAVAGKRTFAPQRLIDLTVPAIVAADAVLDGAHLYAPLVVGHLTDLPELEPLDAGRSLCEFVLTEDSPWEFRIGSAVAPAAGTFPASLLPNWLTPPTQTPEHGLQFGRIGQQRERTIEGEERATRWRCDAGFWLKSKTEIATFLGFFIASRGQWAPFDAPLWYQPGVATAQAPHTTKVRFESNVLKLEFISAGDATVRAGFVQLPWEVAGTVGETPQQTPRIFLYQFTYAVPGPVVWRFTNCWRPLARAGDGTYTPAPMEHKELGAGLDLQSENLSLESFLFDGNPLALFNPNVLEGRLWLRVYEVESATLDTSTAVLRWYGAIPSAPQTGRLISAEGEWLGGILDRELPAVRIGPKCNTWLFSSRCGHSKAAFAKNGTLASSAGNVVTVSIADGAAANTYVPGKLELGSGLAYESRTIVASAPVVGGQQLTLDRPLRQAASGQAVTYYRGCDLSLASCKALDAAGWRARFRGHPFVPQVNLSLPQATTETPTKK